MYLKTIFSLTFSLTLLVAGVNFFVNPIGIYNPPMIKGLNDAQPAASAYLRLEKIEAVKRLKPDAIITGSSRADIGLDPRPEFFPGMTPYNFGLPASTINEQRMTLEFAQTVHPLKEAIITLDLLSFNAHMLENKQFDTKRLSPEALSPARSFFDSYGTIVALDTFVASIKHLRYIKHLDRYSYCEPNGHKVVNDVLRDIAMNGAASMFGDPAAALKGPQEDFSFSYSDKPDDTSYKQLEAMLDFARQHKIKVIMLISPLHKRGTEDQTAMDREWKSRLAEIVRENAARYGEKPYPLWDFNYRNSLTVEPIPPAGDKKTRLKWFLNSGHYTTEAGDIIFAKILDLPEAAKYPDFGRRL